MKVFVDNRVAKILAEHPLKVANDAAFLKFEGELSFGWTSLLAYLGLESILNELSPFSHETPLFDVCISILSTANKKEILFELYDRLFAENLTQIKSLPQVKAPFLLEAIKTIRKTESYVDAGHFLSKSLDSIEQKLVEQSGDAMHDLILYLGWERMCICISRLFDHQSANAEFQYGISVLKECLIESFVHITGDGRTRPSLYRLLEALFIYEMREENLQKVNDAEWTYLSQSFGAMKSQNELVDYYYVDEAVVLEKDLQHRIDQNGKELVHCLTLDSRDVVDGRVNFANFMVDKLRRDSPAFSYVLCPVKITQIRPKPQ